MRRGFIPALLLGLLLVGCNSTNSASPSNTATSTATSTVTSTATSTVTSSVTSTVTDTTPDAGCDEDAVGENYYIQNCTPGGNGTPILRQIPTVVQNNCQP